jgi:dihydrofolate reductase
VTFVAEEAATVVRRLKEDEEGKDICVMGGGVLAQSLFEADLIDEIGFNIQPVLLGSGIPLFYEMSRQIDLELKECRQLSKGCVYLTYKVKHAKVKHAKVKHAKVKHAKVKHAKVKHA